MKKDRVTLVTVLFVRLNVSSHTAVRTLACGTDRFIAWGRCGTRGTAVSLCGRAEDTFLLFASVTALFIALKAAEFLLNTVDS
jgi:hypothetical protein